MRSSASDVCWSARRVNAKMWSRRFTIRKDTLLALLLLLSLAYDAAAQVLGRSPPPSDLIRSVAYEAALSGGREDSFRSDRGHQLQQSLSKRKLPSFNSCGAYKESRGRWCTFASGRVDTYYEKCFTPSVVVLDDFDDEDGDKAPASQETHPTNGEPANDEAQLEPLPQDILDELGFAVGGAYPYNGFPTAATIATTTRLRHAPAGTIGGRSSVDRRFGKVDRIEHTCPHDYVCIQAFDKDDFAHVLCRSPPRFVSTRSGPGSDVDAASAKAYARAKGYGRTVDADGTTYYDWVEPHLASGTFFPVDVAELLKGQPTVTNTPDTPTVVKRKFTLQLPPSDADNDDWQLGEERMLLISVVIYDTATLQVVVLDVATVDLTMRSPDGKAFHLTPFTSNTPLTPATPSTSSPADGQPREEPETGPIGSPMDRRPRVNAWAYRFRYIFTQQEYFFMTGEFMEYTLQYSWTQSARTLVTTIGSKVFHAVMDAVWRTYFARRH